MAESRLRELKDAAAELIKFCCSVCDNRLCEEDVVEEDGQYIAVPCSPILRMQNALHANPDRQCDVGTAEEQAERFHLQCFEYHTGRCSPHCGTLPAKTRQECALKWAQMPYGADKETNEEEKRDEARE